MLETTGVHLEQFDQESAILILLDKKDIVSDQLSDKVAAKFWRDLECVHSK